MKKHRPIKIIYGVADVLAVLGALLLGGGCSNSSSYDAQTIQLKEKLSTVTVADGISKLEAELIAQCYFHRHNGHGMFTGIRDGGDVWMVDGMSGRSLKPIKDFHIGKTTGRVKSSLGTDYAKPSDIFP